MIIALFSIMMICAFGKLFMFGLRAAWGLLKFTCLLVFLPIALIGMACLGLIYLALPIVLIVGIVALICSATA